MLKRELLDILVCPQCKGTLEYDSKQAELLCHVCKLAYPVKDDIPVMLIEDARRIDE